MVERFSELFGNDGKLTPTSRFIMVAFALIGMTCAPFVVWFAKGAYDEFKGQTEKLSSIQLYLSAAQERARHRDERTTAIEVTNNKQQTQIEDHERRLIRIESVRGAQ